jgi:hypothetical protein
VVDRGGTKHADGHGAAGQMHECVAESHGCPSVLRARPVPLKNEEFGTSRMGSSMEY